MGSFEVVLQLCVCLYVRVCGCVCLQENIKGEESVGNFKMYTYLDSNMAAIRIIFFDKLAHVCFSAGVL